MKLTDGNGSFWSRARRDAGARMTMEPTAQEVVSAHGNLRRAGNEWNGPCPICGGTDRFHLREKPDGTAMFGCRVCCDGKPQDVKRAFYGNVLRALFPSWADDFPAPEIDRIKRGLRNGPDFFKWYRILRGTHFPAGTDPETRCRFSDAKHVYRVLADHAWAGEEIVRPGYRRLDGETVVLIRTIARESSLSKRTVIRSLAFLENEGLIVRESRGRRGGGRAANRYRLVTPSWYEKAKVSSGHF